MLILFAIVSNSAKLINPNTSIHGAQLFNGTTAYAGRTLLLLLFFFFTTIWYMFFTSITELQ